MLKLRRARVVALRGAGPEQELVVELQDGSRRPAIADVTLLGRCEPGDDVIVNVQALDLALGSGGFDIVHVNLTRGLDGEGTAGAHVMKLNYTSIQHAVLAVEEETEVHDSPPASALGTTLGAPVAVLALHGQLPALAWAFAAAAPQAKLGYVQTPGGALCGTRSRVVRALRERGLLAAHVTAGSAFGGETEAMSTAGALRGAQRALGCDAIVCGPGPGIVGSGSALGHGGMQALDSAHTALALGARTLLVARMSCSDPRARHRGISHHTLTVLELLLAPVSVAVPSGPLGSGQLGSGPLGSGPLGSGPLGSGQLGGDPSVTGRHLWRSVSVDLDSYAASGLPADTMGRSLKEDPLFFASALAAGTALAEMMAT